MKNNVNNYTLHNEPLEQLHVVPEDDIKLKKYDTGVKLQVVLQIILLGLVLQAR